MVQRLLVEFYAPRYLGKALAQAAAGDQQVHRRIFDDPLQALLRVVDIQWHISGAGLHHRQEGNDHLYRPLQRNANAGFRAHALGDQVMGQAVGAGIQLGIGQLLPATDHCHGRAALMGMPGDTFGEQRLLAPRCRKLVTQVGMLRLRRRQHAQAAQGGLGVVQHGGQQAFETAAQALDSCFAKAVAQVQELYREGVAQLYGQVHGIVGDVAVAHLAKAQRSAPALAQAVVNRVVLEHHDAVEQRLPRPPGPTLHIGQRRVLVVAQLQVVVLQLVQPVADNVLRLRCLHHWQRIDEQAQHFICARQAGGAPGHGGAEAHGGLAGVALQQQQPAGLDQGIGRDPQAPGLVTQLLRALRIPTQVLRMVPDKLAVGLWRDTVGQQRRAVQRP
ncbi:hypothetical protein D9M71_328390 [compost metagenome]